MIHWTAPAVVAAAAVAVLSVQLSPVARAERKGKKENNNKYIHWSDILYPVHGGENRRLYMYV